MSPSIPDTSKVVPPHPFETFRPSTDYSNFEADVIRPAIRAARSRAELSQAPDPGCPVFSAPRPSLEETLQFLLETDYNHPGHRLRLPPPLSTPKLSATIPLTRTTSVVGYVSNKHPDCYVWQSGFFEAGSHVVLGTTYRKAKIVGPDGVGRNYMMVKLEEVGRIPKDRIAIQRMVVSTRPSSQFYQLSFRQRLLRFFLNRFLLNRFLGTFRDFADDDDDSFEKDIQSVKSSDQSSDSFSSNSELFDEVEFSSEEMCENGTSELSMDEEGSVSY
jgi:hypothetical protein